MVIKPDYHIARLGKGFALGNLGQYELAIAVFEQALAIKPDDYGALDNKGYALATKGYFGEAIVCFDKAIAINPTHANAIYNKAFAVHPANLGAPIPETTPTLGIFLGSGCWLFVVDC